LKVFVVFGRVSASDAIGFVMDVPCRMIGMNYEPIYLGRIEVKDAGLPVIDP
jgi:hypothetical protein